MKFGANSFDLWIYRRDPDAIRYLPLRTSQEKADRWFNGGRFWQIPGEFVADEESIVTAADRCLAEYGVSALSLWAVEHTYTVYNRRRERVELILVLAAEVRPADTVPLTWEHSEYRWATAGECRDLLTFRGLIEGLEWTCRYITEADKLHPELRLA